MFEEHLQNTIALLQGNPVIGIGVAVVVLALFYFRLKVCSSCWGSACYWSSGFI